ncbi:MAG: head-tail connector protein [Pseudomonadota bacterium]
MWSEPVTVTAPASLPVSVADAKTFIRVDHDDEDALISTLIGAAVSRAEGTTGTRFVAQDVTIAADGWSDLDQLPIGPVRSVASIIYEDSDGVDQTLAAERYEVFGAGLSQGIRPVINDAFPDDARCIEGSILVTMSVGYDSLPEGLIAALLLMVGDLYANRETVSKGAIAPRVMMSMQVETLLNQHRFWL